MCIYINTFITCNSFNKKRFTLHPFLPKLVIAFLK